LRGEDMEKFYSKELIEELRDIQDTYGYIPEEQIVKIAVKKNIPKAHLYGVISFYSMLYLEPTGKYIIRLCNSVSCRLNNSTEILRSIKEFLKIENGGTTKDKKFTLEVAECLGHCGEGPVMMINGQVYSFLTPEEAIKILKSLQ